MYFSRYEVLLPEGLTVANISQLRQKSKQMRIIHERVLIISFAGRARSCLCVRSITVEINHQITNKAAINRTNQNGSTWEKKKITLGKEHVVENRLSA